METERFISGRLRFGGGLSAAAVAVSFFVIILAVSVSAGFRREIRSGIALIAGDICVEGCAPEDFPEGIPGVVGVEPVVYRTGIVKSGDNIQGVVFKGVRSLDSLDLAVSIPSGLSGMLGLREGDAFVTYFVDGSVRARKFTVASVYDNLVQADDRFIIHAGFEDILRIEGGAGLEDNAALELTLAPEYRTRASLMRKTQEVGVRVYPAVATSSVDRYPQLFDWLDLIDFNVLAIIVLMTVVAGFNMISGLLIMLFRSVSEIGILKSMGMTDKSVSKVFVRVAARIVLKGLAIGNAAALLFCAVQGKWHLLKLNPENYFVSFVPVDVNVAAVLAADLIAFAVIMLLMLLPSLFISRVDPSRTVRTA